MKKTIIVLFTLIMVISFVFMGTGCKAAGTAETTAAAAAETTAAAAETTAADFAESGTGDKGTIALLYSTIDIPVVVVQREMNEKIAAEHGYKTIFIEAGWDAAKQADQFQNAINQDVKGILTLVVDAKAIIPSLQAAKAAGIPVVTEDSGAYETEEARGLVASHVTSDNYRAGELCGEYIAWRLGGKGKIAEIGWKAVEGAYARQNGLHNVLKAFPEIEFVAYGEAVSVPDGLTVMQNIIQSQPDLDAVYAVNDPGALGAYQAIKAAGKLDDIFISTNDGDPEALKLMSEGKGQTYAFDMCQWPQLLGTIGMENLIAIIEGRTDDIQQNEEIIGRDPYWPVMKICPFPVSYENLDKWPGWDATVTLNDAAPVPPYWTVK